MNYRKCPKCGLNYITDNEKFCEVCRCNRTKPDKGIKGENKRQVEEVLLPLLRTFPQSYIDELTKKKESFEFLGLRLPLLIECQEIDREHCKKEVIVDSGATYRYYIESYDINGKKYHICSQWWNTSTNNSKHMLELLKKLADKKETNNI